MRRYTMSFLTVSGACGWTGIKTRDARRVGSVTCEIQELAGGLPTGATVTEFGMWC